MNPYKLYYQVDEQLVNRFVCILANKDKEAWKDFIIEVESRLDGRCFCSAYSTSECVCGAWDK